LTRFSASPGLFIVKSGSAFEGRTRGAISARKHGGAAHAKRLAEFKHIACLLARDLVLLDERLAGPPTALYNVFNADYFEREPSRRGQQGKGEESGLCGDVCTVGRRYAMDGELLVPERTTFLDQAPHGEMLSGHLSKKR
jgi:hypothetical protein